MANPLLTAHGRVDKRHTTLIRMRCADAFGWGECVALDQTGYSAESARGEFEALKNQLVPALLGQEIETVKQSTGQRMQHRAANASIELAVLDLVLRQNQVSLKQHWDAQYERVRAARVISMNERTSVISEISDCLGKGITDFKLKIDPNVEVQFIESIQRDFPNVRLRLDANGSFDWNNVIQRDLLTSLDQLNLEYIEQPFSAVRPDVVEQYEQAKAVLQSPIAIDEAALTLSDIKRFVEGGLCGVVCIKPAVIGGYDRALQAARWCKNNGAKVVLGGMVDGAIARSANLALAATATFHDFAAEVSEDGRWFSRSVLTAPVELVNGEIVVPLVQCGIGEVDQNVVQELCVEAHVLAL